MLVYNTSHVRTRSRRVALGALSLLLGTAVASVACTQVFPEWNRGRSFTVVVTIDKKPLGSTLVTLAPGDLFQKLNRIEVLTDENGVASFNRVTPGRYELWISRLGIEVDPGTVIVHERGGSDVIPASWPLKAEYKTLVAAGRFQRPFFSNQSTSEELVHPSVEPLAGADLALTRIDSQKTIGYTTTDSDGAFSFPTVEPGSYLLRIKEKTFPVPQFQIDGYLVLVIDPHSSRGDLRLQLEESSCGLLTREIR